MIRSIQDFLQVWEGEAESTEKLFSQLTDHSLHLDLVASGRTMGRLAWHIVQTPPEMLARTGLTIDGPGEHAPVPGSVAEIVSEHHRVISSVVRQLPSWTDADLEREDFMYGESWKRSFTLSVLLLHLVHHRGQLTVLMRLAGLTVPGLYGRAREEWGSYGMPVPEI